MDLTKIPAGKNPPDDLNVIIEVPMRADPVKYEFDKEARALVVDRFLHTPMYYPANYGFIPNTLGGDGDPLDVLVVAQVPIQPGAIVRVRPVGMLEMEDDGGRDEKIVAVPVSKLDPYFDDIKEYTDLPALLRGQIAHFFERYKDLEAGKWVRIGHWKGLAETRKLIEEGVANAAK